MKTYSQKPSDVSRRWVLVDASELPLGRLATVIATHLTGKYKPTYTPHIDGGDYVVVINAAQAVVTGNKETDKIYYHHTGFPGGIKDASLAEVRAKFPERIIENAVKGMLPKNKLAAERMKRLRVFAGSEHAHTAQNPEKVEVK
ncbi:MAG: 50S ribosomal protein L13 [Candidatus Saccharibacteria bacterium]|nr:50S ribosomal protein L13 [Candidatus Saccharibacteria bacterium]MDO4780870.1 50S ribosomal protein L13 [Candidatus Saccharibacteria bacterium]